ncbi:FAD-binding and BBE domain-containing protein [Hibiscus syriacus]|uniref:FAD-binding and BBE domain-containing protein n=1 Tax=Hibiscus syriacus TaxID=106335 RepID=A0A6A3CYA7_HIBSY|nr:berberine bridge enzyme-like 7 [Hibiscus syriacus]KAE8734565.1 FAD-binding and BBE domain-containing protein [Hibiscus syriacus]
MKGSSCKLLILLLSISLVTSQRSCLDEFLQCLPLHSNPSYPIANAIHTAHNASFQHLYELHAVNLRILSSPSTSKPLAIITALHASHAQAAVVCAKHHKLQLRIRSGGHDYEGLSYTSDVPFFILDLFNLRSIKVDVATETAWVQAGATTGELYYRIAEKSGVHGFPSGVCTTLGIGGHFSGGGYGNMMRKYGLSIDNVVDAHLIDANGMIRNRKSMGEDVFWAIRGGGGTSFGIILSWKIKLVRVPRKVTVFNVQRTLDQGATDLAYRWQQIAPKMPKHLFIRLQLEPITDATNGNKTIRVSFIGQFLGRAHRLVQESNSKFRELGLNLSDCKEMSWAESTLFWAGYPNGTSIDTLLQRVQGNKVFFKTKSDYYKKVIPKQGLEMLWELLMEIGNVFMQLNPHGGRMEEIPESETAYPQRAGYLFKTQYTIHWTDSDGGIGAAEKHVRMSRRLYRTMASYASSNPREAFVNYRDLDIGSNGSNDTDFSVARVYGTKYFKKNFMRLARVKAMADPDNFFKNEQSIRPLPSH